jgi:hypothetical protein
MGNVSLGKKRFGGAAITVALLFTILLSSPAFAAASTVLPMQVLPAGTGKACPAVTVSDIVAHIYNGNLDSFDITLSDSSYVALSTSVNESDVAFNYITRWAYPDGSIKMHVDLQSIRMNKDVPVEITFLSSQSDIHGNRVTCLFNIPALIEAVTLMGGGEAGASQAPSSPATIPNPPSAGNKGSGGQNGQIGEGTSTMATSNPGIVAAVNSLGNLCADGGATRLWVVLLVLFALFAFTLSVQRFEPNTSVRDWNIGLILAVFVGLLVFWYASAVCRTGPWAPAVATFITIVGLLYSMLRTDDTQEILLLKDGQR